MKLYFSRGACSLAIRILLHEIGIKADYEAVDLKSKLTENGDNYLALNPKGAVPALLLSNNELLTENCVIQQYLADTYSASSLLPAAGIERYRALEWLNYVSSDLHKACGPFFNPLIPDELKESAFKPLLLAKLNYVNEHLSRQEYLTGNQFSLADGYFFVVLSWLKGFHIHLSDWPNLENYHSQIKQRPSVKQALQEESLPW